ncbi:hypothetical protein [Amycolatopsis australiensis]|uniref:Uncharacterized protein n=1 Tax=Amycolatopsis australiensis TaxID=546364 RepID=A0A1K1PRU3_9PSEU|nr:hypothetical protein [Amycolatopsis australiensis]SFW50281.1 hypothetical protein SAMN04489730_0933 [Amycolatopsis australiensis]
MRIRLEGTEHEITATIARLATVLTIEDASDFYPNRRRGAKYLPPTADVPAQGRVYLIVTAPAPSGPVRAEAERTDQARRLPPANRKEIR